MRKEKRYIYIYIYISYTSTAKEIKKTRNHLQKYFKDLIQKEYTSLQHIWTISALSLPSKTKKLVLTLTTAILCHIWKTRDRLQFDKAIIFPTNTIINIKNDLKNTKQTHYKKHVRQNSMDEFKNNFVSTTHYAT